VRGVGVAAGGPYRCGVGVDAGLQCMLGQHVNGEKSATECRGAMGASSARVRASLWHGSNDVVVNPVNLDALALMFARLAGSPRARRIAVKVRSIRSIVTPPAAPGSRRG